MPEFLTLLPPGEALALLFDRDWQKTMTAQMGRPLPLPATIDAAVTGCRQAAIH